MGNGVIAAFNFKALGSAASSNQVLSEKVFVQKLQHSPLRYIAILSLEFSSVVHSGSRSHLHLPLGLQSQICYYLCIYIYDVCRCECVTVCVRDICRTRRRFSA